MKLTKAQRAALKAAYNRKGRKLLYWQPTFSGNPIYSGQYTPNDLGREFFRDATVDKLEELGLMHETAFRRVLAYELTDAGREVAATL